MWCEKPGEICFKQVGWIKDKLVNSFTQFVHLNVQAIFCGLVISCKTARKRGGGVISILAILPHYLLSFFLTLFHVQRSLHFSELRHHPSNFVCFFGSYSFTGNTAEHFRTPFHRPDFFPVLDRGIFRQCLSTRLHTCSRAAAAAAAAEPAAEIALMCRMSPECWVRKPQIPNASVALSSECTNCEFLAHTDHIRSWLSYATGNRGARIQMMKLAFFSLHVSSADLLKCMLPVCHIVNVSYRSWSARPWTAAVLSDLFLHRYSWILQVGTGADAVSILQGQRENGVKEPGVEADIWLREQDSTWQDRAWRGSCTS